MKRQGSGSLSSIFHSRKQSSGTHHGLRKAEHGGSQARRGLLSSGGTSGSKSMSLDGQAAAEPAGQLEVTSPPPRQLGMAQPHEAAEPDSPPRAMLTPGAAALSSPFADWRPSFDFDLPPPPPFGKPGGGGGGGGGRCLEEDLGRLAHPSGGAAGKAAAPAAERDPRSQQEQHALENDENANWLVSPARPPARAVPSMLQTPEKDGLGLLPMPSLSSWMVPATTKPAAAREEPPRMPEGAMDEVLSALNFDPAVPRKLDRSPSPLDRLLGELGDSDFAPTVAQWDAEQLLQ